MFLTLEFCNERHEAVHTVTLRVAISLDILLKALVILQENRRYMRTNQRRG